MSDKSRKNPSYQAAGKTLDKSRSGMSKSGSKLGSKATSKGRGKTSMNQGSKRGR